CFKDNFQVMFFDDLVASPAEYLAQFCKFTGVSLPNGGIQIKPTPETEPIPRFPLLSSYSARIGLTLRRRQMYRALEIIRSMVRPLIFNLGAPQNKIEISALCRDAIRQYYRHEVLQVSELTDRDLTAWLA